MSNQIIGGFGTDPDAIMILQDPEVTEWLCEPGAQYRVYVQDLRRNNTDYIVDEFSFRDGDLHMWLCRVKVTGQSLRNLRWECACGAQQSQIPCRHALMAWASRNVRKARQVASLARRMQNQQQK